LGGHHAGRPEHRRRFESADLSDQDVIRQVLGGNTAMFERLIYDRLFHLRLTAAQKADLVEYLTSL